MYTSRRTYVINLLYYVAFLLGLNLKTIYLAYWINLSNCFIFIFSVCQVCQRFGVFQTNGFGLHVQIRSGKNRITRNNVECVLLYPMSFFSGLQWRRPSRLLGLRFHPHTGWLRVQGAVKSKFQK